ncbi:hemolysin XhlA family protein [Endozoicomonas sp. 4G]|uniref:hemolysin XhlA family protein n=1 Tax=Endozoicomonas sp. 4G TaxID=2872754 RepID=UPI0020791DD4|nr:hemolysin XhlA family protein [Endozoicomonas sp. 4G]
MRIKLPILTEALERAGTEQELAINASNEVCALVEGYRREMSRMFEQVERRLSRQINEVVGQAMSRIDEHFIHIGDVQMEQHKQIQQILSGVMFLNQRQDRMEERLGRMEERQDRMEERLGRMEERLGRMEERQDRMEADIKELKAGQIEINNKLDEILKRL